MYYLAKTKDGWIVLVPMVDNKMQAEVSLHCCWSRDWFGSNWYRAL